MFSTASEHQHTPSTSSADWLLALLAVAAMTANLAVQWLVLSAGR